MAEPVFLESSVGVITTYSGDYVLHERPELDIRDAGLLQLIGGGREKRDADARATFRREFGEETNIYDLIDPNELGVQTLRERATWHCPTRNEIYKVGVFAVELSRGMDLELKEAGKLVIVRNRLDTILDPELHLTRFARVVLATVLQGMELPETIVPLDSTA